MRRMPILMFGIYGTHRGHQAAGVRKAAGAGCVEGQEKEWMWCILDDLKAFGINADQWANTTQDEWERRKTAEQEIERFMVKWIAAEKARAGPRHTGVVSQNVRSRAKENIAQASVLVMFRSP